MTKRNVTNSEKEYFNTIDSLKAKSTKDLIASAPFLFSNRVAVQSLISRYELYKLIGDVPGDVVECGVYQGNSFLWLAHLSVILEPFSINRRFIGFDTFNGFASIDENADPNDVSPLNFSDTSMEIIQESLDAIDALRPVNKIERFKLVQGDITKTVPEFIDKNPSFTCAMLILDTDLYQPTLVALKNIVPQMPKGGIVVLDEFNYQNFKGETQALKEFESMNKIKMKKIKHDSCLAYFEIE